MASTTTHDTAPPSSGAPNAPNHGGAAQIFTLDLAALLLRVAFGLTLALVHGLKKLTNPGEFIGHVATGFPAPELLGWAAMLSEFAGGLFLALGVFTRSAATAVAGTLLVAAIKVHAADLFAKKELALAYAAIGLAFALGGPGRYSVDGFIARRLRVEG
jgi:putative oxidoreductase